MKGKLSSYLQFVIPTVLYLSAIFGPAAVGQTGNSPRLFAAGVISGPADDLSPAFSADGKVVYFTRSNGSISTILMSNLQRDHWTVPVVAPFSGEWNDLEPAMAPY